MSTELSDALRRVDRYAAKACRDLGLEVPKAWQPTRDEWVAETAAAINVVAQKLAQVYEPVFKLLRSPSHK